MKQWGSHDDTASTYLSCMDVATTGGSRGINGIAGVAHRHEQYLVVGVAAMRFECVGKKKYVWNFFA